MWVASDKLKSAMKNNDTLYFGNATHRVLYERSNIATSFADHLIFQKKWLLHMQFEKVTTNQNKNPSIKELW